MDLVFSRPRYVPGDPLDLVFGDTLGPEILPLTLQGTLYLEAPEATGTLLYDNRLPATVSAGFTARHQVAAPAQVQPVAPWGQPAPADQASASAWQSADRAAAAPVAPWDKTDRADTPTRTGWQAATPVSQQRGMVYQACTPLDVLAAIGWQLAVPATVNLLAPHQVADVLHQLRTVSAQQGAPTIARAHAPHQVATPAQRAIRARWQVAAQLIPPGLTVLVPPGEGGITPHPVNLDLVFACPPYEQGAPIDLVFGHVCLPPTPGALIVVPTRTIYMTYNNLTLKRVAGNVPLPALGVSLSIDDNSFTWAWSANFAGTREVADVMAALDPDSGDPVEVELSINGVAYRLLTDPIDRQRQFARSTLRVPGRGLAAELDSPSARQMVFSQASPRTAQQLANEALQVNGVGIGWDVDWGLTDWLVPGGVWSHQGTHRTAVSEIAAAAGGYVQPHRTARTLRVLPRYPAPPWEWSALTPDIELPSGPVVVEGIEWQRLPDYNRVYVQGEGQGVRGQVTRAGTAGDVDAPMFVHPLITAADAARQAGTNILSKTGKQALVTLRLPVLDETGVILPGKLVRYVDGSTTRLGLVRSTAVSWQRPQLRQTIKLETHILEGA